MHRPACTPLRFGYSQLRALLAGTFLMLSGCASLYFDRTEAPDSPIHYGIDQLPQPDQWMGIVFNGNKIGFSHLTVQRGDSADNFMLHSRAALRFHFLMLDKSVNITTRDWVDASLSLQRFDYNYNLDGNTMRVTGHVKPGQLIVAIQDSSGTTDQITPLDGPLYPASALNLYPVLHGLEIGRRYHYLVYDGESQRVATVEQEVVAFEQSKLFKGAAFKLRTKLHGNTVSSWIDMQGSPLLEMAMNGVFISARETEAMAKQYLALAALNKQDALLDFSLVRTTPIVHPRNVTSLTIELGSLPDELSITSDAWQQCELTGNGTWRCHISQRPTPYKSNQDNTLTLEDYLQPSLTVPHVHPEILNEARAIAGTLETPDKQARALVSWLNEHIDQQAADVFNAVDVLRTRKAECQGHSYLYAAFARALDIPTRIVNGLVYSEPHQGFLYHTWTESWIDGRWQAIDPTFGQVNADATHIKLVEGESLADLAPLTSLVGRLEARIIDYAPRAKR